MLKPIGRIESPERSIHKSSHHIPADPNPSGGVRSAELGASGSPPHELKCEHPIISAGLRARSARAIEGEIPIAMENWLARA